MKPVYSTSNTSRRFGVVGAGLAGLAVSYRLLSLCSRLGLRGEVLVKDVIGVGGGTSSVAAGLVHPYSPRGKLLWKGREAFNGVQELALVAEEVANRKGLESVFKNQGLLFEARTEKQLQTFEALQDDSGIFKIRQSQALDLLPGIGFQRRSTQNDDDFYGLFIPQGMLIEPTQYMDCLWIACQELVDQSNGMLDLELRNGFVKSLSEFREQNGPFDGIVVTTGATIGCIEELTGILPLRLCQGASITLNPTEGHLTDFAEEGPSLLGSIYLAGQSSREIKIGATREYGLTDEQAFSELTRNANKAWDQEYVKTVESYLHEQGNAIWTPLSKWTIRELKTGVRALPPMTQLGALPLIGHLPPDLWILTGLGSRGVLYHAYLASILAESIILKNPEMLPIELTSWSRKIEL